MPSIASHFVVAKKVGIILNINSNDFYLGNILPDIIDLKDSHHKIKGKYYYIPDIDRFMNNQNYSHDILVGYLTHLLLDKYYLDYYLINNIDNYDKFDLFTPDCIYKDYSIINYSLVKDYNLDKDFIIDIMINNKFNINKEKLDINIKNINNKFLNKPKYINYDSFKKFLNGISIIIAKDIDNLLN